MANDLTEDDNRRLKGKLLVDDSEVGDRSKSNTDCWGLNYSSLNTATGVQTGHSQLCGWRQTLINIDSKTGDRVSVNSEVGYNDGHRP